MANLKTLELGTTLSALFTSYEGDRLYWEKQALQNYRQWRGEYDPEIEINKNRSHAYPRMTRVKGIAVIARLMQMLFPVSEKNWGLDASPIPNMSPDALRTALRLVENPQATDEEISTIIMDFAKGRAEAMEKEITDQMIELGGTKELPYVSLVKKIIEYAVKYGLGILKGPLVREQQQTRWMRLPTSGEFDVQQIKVFRPHFSVVSPWSYYMDRSAQTFNSMDGEFERIVMNRRQLVELAKKPGFNADQIKEYIEAHRTGDFRWRTFEQQLRRIGTEKDRRLDAANKFEPRCYWGQAKVGEMREALKELSAVSEEDGTELSIASELADDDMIEIQAWLLGHYVIKAEVNPYDPWLRPYHHFVFEEDESSLGGEGLPWVMRDSALAIGAGARMLIDNAAVSTGPMFEVNRGLLTEGEDVKTIQAFRTWERDDDGTTAQFPAIREIRVNSHIPELLQVIATFREFADQESFIMPAMQADFSNKGGEPFRSAQGSSLLLSNSSLPFRDVVRNFDAFTLSVISSLVQWNMQFSDKEEIKGDHQVIARGSASLIAKEVRATALDGFVNQAIPEEREHINMREVTAERARVRDLDPDRVMLSQADVDAASRSRAVQAEQARMIAIETQEAEIQHLKTRSIKDLAQANKSGAQADALLAETVAGAGE